MANRGNRHISLYITKDSEWRLDLLKAEFGSVAAGFRALLANHYQEKPRYKVMFRVSQRAQKEQGGFLPEITSVDLHSLPLAVLGKSEKVGVSHDTTVVDLSPFEPGLDSIEPTTGDLIEFFRHPHTRFLFRLPGKVFQEVNSKALVFEVLRKKFHDRLAWDEFGDLRTVRKSKCFSNPYAEALEFRMNLGEVEVYNNCWKVGDAVYAPSLTAIEKWVDRGFLPEPVNIEPDMKMIPGHPEDQNVHNLWGFDMWEFDAWIY